MLRLKVNKQGFSTVKALVIVVVLVVIGAGLYALSKHSEQTSKSAAGQNPNLKSYVLKHEGLHFSYPRDWQIKDTSANGNDAVTLTGPSDFTATIQTGIASSPSLAYSPKILFAEPAMLASQAIFLVFLSGPQSDGLVNQIYVSKSATDAFVAPAAVKSIGHVIIAHAGYASNRPGEALSATAKDKNYLAAKTIVQSMHY